MKRSILLLIALIVTVASAQATTYTAIKDGKYSHGSTWQNGVAPPSVISNDSVLIENGLNITLDVNLSVINAGFLRITHYVYISGEPGKYLSFATAANSLLYSCSITVDSVYLGPGDYDDGSGPIGRPFVDIFAKSLTLDGAEKHATVDCEVSKQFRALNNIDFDMVLHFISPTGVPDLILEEDISVGNSVVYGNYNLTYKASKDIIPENELYNSDVQDLTIDIGANNKLLLSKNVTITGHMHVASGIVELGETHLKLDSTANLTFGTDGLLYTVDKDTLTLATADVDTIQLKFYTDPLPYVTKGRDLSELNINTKNDSCIVRIDDKLIIYDQLRLLSGKIFLEKNSILLYSDLNLIGGRSDKSYIITGFNSTLDIRYETRTEKFFPIGTDKHYAPLYYDCYSDVPRTESFQAIDGFNSYRPKVGNLFDTANTINTYWYYPYQIFASGDITVHWTDDMELNNFDVYKTSVLSIMDLSPYIPENLNIFHPAAGGLDPLRPNPYSYDSSLNMHSLRFISQAAFYGGPYPFALLPNPKVSVNDIQKEDNTITLHPNPATEILTITNKEHSSVTAIMQDVTGKVVRTITLQRGENIIDVNDLAGGVYMVTFKNTNMQTTKKFVKQ